jgi:hypothetical protein
MTAREAPGEPSAQVHPVLSEIWWYPEVLEEAACCRSAWPGVEGGCVVHGGPYPEAICQLS